MAVTVGIVCFVLGFLTGAEYIKEKMSSHLMVMRRDLVDAMQSLAELKEQYDDFVNRHGND